MISLAARAALGLVAYALVFALAGGVTRLFETVVQRMPVKEKLYMWVAYVVVLFMITFGVMYASLRIGDPIVI